MYPLLVETPSADPRQRSAWNVRDSDATLIVLSGDSSESPGTEFTRICAELIFQRRLCVANLGEPGTFADAQRWLATLLGAPSATFDLNVAGPRESESPGIAFQVSQVLREIITGSITASQGSGEHHARSAHRKG